MLILFLIILVILLIIIFGLDYYNKQQIETKIIYANSIEPVTIDTQFSPTNFPSYVFKDTFESSSPWIGGTTIGKNALIVPSTVTPYSVLYPSSSANLILTSTTSAINLMTPTSATNLITTITTANLTA
jgi:hypothetical protein